MYPTQNLNNDIPQGNVGYHKLTIDELSLQQKNISVQSQPHNNYPIIQQVQQPVYQPQYQQPYQPPYQQPFQQPYQQSIQQPYFQFSQPFQQQQPIHINPQYNQVAPNIEQLNNQNDNGQNKGQNKRFGLCITSIWAIQSFLDFYVVYIALVYKISQELGILCIFIMFLNTLIVFIINEKQTTVVSIVLFQIFISSSFGATFGFIEIFGRQMYAFYLIFQFYQLVTMTSAFMYLIATQSIPEARYILRITMVVLLITSVYLVLYAISYQDLKGFLRNIISHIIIWFFCCCLQSQILVKILNQVYQGQNKKISKHNIWTGFILFKAHFYIPGL